MASILKRLLAGALALCCVASSAAAESLLRSDNILEARLGAERLVLAPHATKAATAYIGLGVSLYSNMLYRTAPLLAPDEADL